MQCLGNLETPRAASVPALTSPTTEPTTRDPLCPPGAQVPAWQPVEQTGPQTLDKTPGFRSWLYLCDVRHAARPPVPRPSPYPVRTTRGPASPAVRTGCVGPREAPPGYLVASVYRCGTEGHHALRLLPMGLFPELQATSAGEAWAALALTMLRSRPHADIPSRLSLFCHPLLYSTTCRSHRTRPSLTPPEQQIGSYLGATSKVLMMNPESHRLLVPGMSISKTMVVT